jgi:CheY-like chemotaxis protein
MHNSIKRILVVDDEVEFVKSLRRHLRREGYSLEVAYDGLEACRKIEHFSVESKPFDLVITDVVMPNMNGIELLQWIQRQHPEISAILLSGFGENDIAAKTLRPKLDAHGKKPITPKEMTALINSLHQTRGGGGPGLEDN